MLYFTHCVLIHSVLSELKMGPIPAVSDPPPPALLSQTHTIQCLFTSHEYKTMHYITSYLHLYYAHQSLVRLQFFPSRFPRELSVLFIVCFIYYFLLTKVWTASFRFIRSLSCSCFGTPSLMCKSPAHVLWQEISFLKHS
jgi:hypothetical protein